MKNKLVLGRMLQARRTRDLGDELEHRADRAFYIRNLARKRLLRRFPRTDVYG